MCGVFGCIFPNCVDSIGKVICYGLIGLQHRGQEATGISIVKEGKMITDKDFGMVNQVFSEKRIGQLGSGTAGVGHIRYSTFGGHDNPEFIQPHYSKNHGFAVAFNGTIARPFEILGKKYTGEDKKNISDVLLIVDFLETRIEDYKYSLEESLSLFSSICTAAYSMVVLTDNGTVYVLRDSFGYRPLQIAKINYENQKGYIISSEDCAFKIFNYYETENVVPGSIIKLENSKKGIEYSIIKHGYSEESYKQLCAFELVYFSRPDSHFDGRSVSEFREQLGAQLFQEIRDYLDVEIGLSHYNVVGVPDSSTHTAVGFCNASQATFTLGLNKNRYIHRTFIQPTQEMRENMVRMKLNIIPEKIFNNRIILIDDSIVRGTTIRKIIEMIREAKPKEIIVLIACPPIRYSSSFGINFKEEEMIANQVAKIDEDPTEAIRRKIGADKLHFLSIEGLNKCLNIEDRELPKYCTACWTGTCIYDKIGL